MKKIWIIIGILLAGSSSAHAFTATVTGTQVNVNYVEPTQNSDSPPTPLTDLAKTTIYYDLGAGPVKALETAATAPTGGGTIAKQVVVPVLAGQEANVTFWATATDLSGNEGPPSAKVIQRIDRLSPGAPK